MHGNGAFTFMIMNDMTVQQITRIEYTLLKYLNRVNIAGVVAAVEFLPGKNWEELKFTSGSASLVEKAKQADAGIAYSSEIKCNIVADDKKVLSMIDKLEHSDIVIRVLYNSGDWKVVGVPWNPVKLLSEIDVNKSGGYKLTFSCDSINRACFLKD